MSLQQIPVLETMRIKNSLFRLYLFLFKILSGPLKNSRITRIKIGKRSLKEHIRKLLVSSPLTSPTQRMIVVDGILLIRYAPGHMESVLHYTDHYESGTTKLLKRIVLPSMTAIDIGAHFGFYTVLFSKLCGNRGRVYAFEPDPHTYETLSKNICLNGCKNVLAYQLALTDHSGHVHLYLGKESSLTSSLNPTGLVTEEFVMVSATTLDDFLKGLQSQVVNVLKIDTEGSEAAILRGAQRILSRNPDIKIVMEFIPSHLSAAGENPSEFLTSLIEAGFRVWFIDEKTGELQISDGTVPVMFARGGNIYCSRR